MRRRVQLVDVQMVRVVMLDEYRKRQQRITELSKPLKDADLSSAA
jgi:hypothetical protein